jgi:anti-sigma regulatory factor (Ser/Thr protein kinase)
MSYGNGQEVIPSAKRLIRSLRDMGYDFPTAVADLIDNSIEAGATHVTVDVEFDGDNSWVRITDNGLGMSLSQLQEAMRYGSEREYDTEKDLGKFGLGLKTASMSQCQRLSVVSRSNPKLKEIFAYCWDLDHVDATNKWEIVRIDRKSLKFILDGYLANTTGTVVFWWQVKCPTKNYQ